MGNPGSWNQYDPYGGGEQPHEGFEIHYGPYSGAYVPYTPPTLYTMPGPSGRKFTFSGEEIRELLISIGVLTFAFSMVLGGFDDLLVYLIPSFIAVFTGFFLHEMGHKFVAQSYGLRSQFRMSMQGLMLALMTSFLGFLIAAPGAVEIVGYPTKEQSGRTAFAGPGVNVGICFIAFPFIFVGGDVTLSAGLVVFINSFLALFNLIPVFPLDGEKIVGWSLSHYLALVVMALAFFVSSLISY